MRQADEDLRAFFCQDLAHALLMRAIAIGVNEADGDGFDLFRAQTHGEIAHILLVEREQNAAVGGHALGRLISPGARHERLGSLQFEVILIEAVAEGEFERVTKAACGDQRRARPAPLDDCIGRQRRAMDDDVELRGRNIRLFEHHLHAVDHALFGALWRCQHFAGLKPVRRPRRPARQPSWYRRCRRRAGIRSLFLLS